MKHHQKLSICCNDGYSLGCRYWQADKPIALLVMVHGVVSHAAWLESICDSLAARGISCLAADRRGAGMNSKMRGDAPDGETLLSDISTILKWASSTKLPCHLAGFCWGANYIVNYIVSEQYTKQSVQVQTLALLAPSLFPSAIITDQPFETGDSSIPDQEPIMPIECFTDGPAFDNFIKPDPLRLKHVSPRMNRIMSEFSTGMWMKFLRLQRPTLVLLGADDEVVDNDATQRLFERLECRPKALKMLKSKHGVQFDAPDDVVQHVYSWIFEHHENPGPVQLR